jgi:hypothetical protein
VRHGISVWGLPKVDKGGAAVGLRPDWLGG